MVRGTGFNLLVLICSIFLFSFVSSSITMNQPLANYNFGDTIYLNVDVNPSTVSGSFEMNLICQNGEVNFYKISPAASSFSANKDQKVNHQILLTKEFIGDLSGDCYIQISLGNERFSSSHFYLSDIINLTPKIDASSYNPGDEISWTLEAVKANGLPLNGFVEVSGIDNKTYNSSLGKFSGQIEIPENYSAGKYKIQFYAYDLDNKEILNKNTVYLEYSVNQVPSSLSIDLINSEVNPGEDVNFVGKVLDQSGQMMTASMTGTYFYSRNGKETFTIDSGKNSSIRAHEDSLPGNYTIQVSYSGLKTQTEFYVRNYSHVDFSFLDNSSVLLVRNTGNVFYSEPLNLKIGETDISLNLSLDVGEEKKFNLQAPDGNYDVSVNDGNNSIQRNLLLTGAVIGVEDVKGFFSNNIYLWIFILLVLVLFLVFFILNRTRNKTFKSGETIKIDKKENLKVKSLNAVNMSRDFVDLSESPVETAESKVSMKGNKDFCSVVSINVKNSGSLGKEGKNKLNEILANSKGKGILDSRGSHLLIIYSPSLTKTFANEILAARTANKIKDKIDDYNKRFNDKIEYNIGANVGDMICSLDGGKLNYTSLGNTILLAKRISDLSTSKFLVSAAFRQKLMRELKVNKFSTLGDSDIFEVTRITDVEANQDKLRDLLKRTGFS